MITFRITADVKEDRRVVLNLPAEVPTGEAELEVTVEPSSPKNKQPQTSQAEGTEARANGNGEQDLRYPLRGSVVRFDLPTEPVAEDDWEALR